MKIPKSVVISEIKEQSVKWWQREWMETAKGATTKTFFPQIEDRLKQTKCNTQIHSHSNRTW